MYEKELVAQLKLGNREAFTRIYELYWQKMLSVAAQKISDWEEAEDIVQDIFVSLWRRRESLEIATTLNAYLAISVKYRVIKAMAKRYNYQRYSDHSMKEATAFENKIEDTIHQAELDAQLNAVIEQLPERCRIIYQLQKQSFLSQKQIAEQLSLSEKTVESQLAKARKRIRAGLSHLFSFIF